MQNQYSIMIVDDEKAIRDSLPAVVDFEQFGFRVCQTARNGQDALEKIKKEYPDVLLLDIRMPILDGLGLLKILTEEMKEYHPFVIMLSGYSDFEYARTAIRYGVKAYLTKPLDEDELIKELEEVKAELDERHVHRANEKLLMQADVVKNMLYSEKPGMRALMEGTFLMHCVILEDDVKELKNAFCKGQKDPYETVRSCIEMELEPEQCVFVRSRGCVLTYLVAEDCLSAYQSSASLLGRHLRYRIKSQGIGCAILLDEHIFAPSANRFRNDYDSHLYALMTRIFWGEETVVSDLNISEPVQFLEQEKEGFEAIRAAFAKNDKEAAVRSMESLLLQAVQKQLNIVMIQELNYRFFYLLQDLLQKAQKGQNSQTTSDKQKIQVQNKLGISGDETVRLTTFDWRESTRYLRHEEWEAAVKHQFLTVADCLTTGSVDEQGTASQVLSYIKRHFKESLSAKEVAAHFFISPVYVGRVIQQASGETFKQYVNRLKMEEAKNLLLSSDRLVYEIAEEVGFRDSKYFISRFTEETGMSPAEYRKKKEKE